MVDKHGVRPDPDAVEAVSAWKAPKTATQLMSFLGFRDFMKRSADKAYPMQQLMCNKGKKLKRNERAQQAIENISQCYNARHAHREKHVRSRL